METKLTVIVDNISRGNLPGEWGLSIVAEHENHKILIDAGASGLFLENLKKQGFSAADMDLGVLSHAHYDHAGGLPVFFRENQNAKFYIRETTAEDCYFKKFIIRKYIGVPRRMMQDFKDRLVAVSGNYELYPGAHLIAHSTRGLDAIGKREMMYRKTRDGWVPDDFSHEQSQVLDTEKGLVIINSCCHGGAANIIAEVKAAFPEKQIYGLIGGFHLYNKSREEVLQVAAEIKKAQIAYICTGHCTKDRAYDILRSELGDKLFRLSTGLVMTF